MTEETPNPFARDFEHQSLRSLYRKMKKTALARFECATRMRRHQTYSLWTISIFSAGLIIFPIVLGSDDVLLIRSRPFAQSPRRP
jgi:hypothetical protein